MRGKVLLLRRGTLLLILTALVAAGIFMAVGGPSFVSASAAKRQLPIYSVEREEKVCAISFDAAWGNEDTQALIDILGKYNVKATFFVVGDWVDKYPESVKALHDAGHEVMNHSLHHDHYNALTADQVVADVTACRHHRRDPLPHPLPLRRVRRPRDLRHPLHGHGAHPVGRGQSGLEGL